MRFSLYTTDADDISQNTQGRWFDSRTGRYQVTIGQLSLRVPACIAGIRRGAFTCVGWQVTLCDPIWPVTSRSSEMGFPWRAMSAFTFYLCYSLQVWAAATGRPDRRWWTCTTEIHEKQPSIFIASPTLLLSVSMRFSPLLDYVSGYSNVIVS